MPPKPALLPATPDYAWPWDAFSAHSAMWSQCLAIQAAMLAPWAAWQAACLQACGLPAEPGPIWFGAVVGGEPLP